MMLELIKKVFILIGLVSASSIGYSQDLNPVTWEQKLTIQEDGKVLAEFVAVMEEGWHIYSTKLKSDEGPIPTSFTFTQSTAYKLYGTVKEGRPEVVHDPNFDMEIAMFSDRASFTQLIQPETNKVKVEGTISYMACNDEMCVFPPETNFVLVAENKNK